MALSIIVSLAEGLLSGDCDCDGEVQLFVGDGMETPSTSRLSANGYVLELFVGF